MHVKARFLVAALLLAAVLAQPSAVLAQQVTGLTVAVHESELRLVIHSDGGVQPVYRLRATVTLPPQEELRSFSLVLDSRSETGERSASSQLVLSLDASGPVVDVPDRIVVTGSLRANGEVKNGLGSYEATGEFVFRNSTASYTLSLEKLRVESPSKGVAYIEAKVRIPRALVKTDEESSLTQLTPRKINEELRRAGITYVTVEELSVSIDAQDNIAVSARVKIDIDRMLDAAVAAGMSRDEAEQVKKLLYSNYRYKTSEEATLSAEAAPGSFTLRLRYSSTAEGDIARVNYINAKLSPLLLKATMAIASGLARENPQVAIIASQLGQAGPVFTVLPPSKSRTHVEARLAAPDRIELSIDYVGDKLVLADLLNAPPEERAGRTLAVLATQLQGLLQSIGTLELVAPGVSQAVPTTVKIEAQPGVEVSQETASIQSLPGVRVKITQPATSTQTHATTTYTRPGTAPSETSTSPTPGSGAAGKQTTTQPSGGAAGGTAASPAPAAGGAAGGQQPPTQTAQRTSMFLVAAAAIVVAAAVAAAIILRRR